MIVEKRIILLLEPEAFPESAKLLLREYGSVRTKVSAEEKNWVFVIFTRLASIIDKTFLRSYPNVKWVVTPTTGEDHIVFTDTNALGVRVISLKGEVRFLDKITATAEHTLGLALACLRRTAVADCAVRKGVWDRYPYKGREINGADVFLIGYGRLGRQVASLYSAFGARVKAYDIDESKVPNDRYLDLIEGVQQADIISIHVSLIPASKGMITFDLLSYAQKQPYIVNTSRGDVVVFDDLVRALECGLVSAVALDVLGGEPNPLTDGVLESIKRFPDRLLVTPHIAGYTRESLEKVELFATKKLINDIERSFHAVKS